MGGLGEGLRILPWTINATPNLVLVGVEKLEVQMWAVPCLGVKGEGERPTRSKCGERSGWTQSGRGGGVSVRLRDESIFQRSLQAVDQDRAGEIAMWRLVMEASEGGLQCGLS